MSETPLLPVPCLLPARWFIMEAAAKKIYKHVHRICRDLGFSSWSFLNVSCCLWLMSTCAITSFPQNMWGLQGSPREMKTLCAFVLYYSHLFLTPPGYERLHKPGEKHSQIINEQHINLHIQLYSTPKGRYGTSASQTSIHSIIYKCHLSHMFWAHTASRSHTPTLHGWHNEVTVLRSRFAQPDSFWYQEITFWSHLYC